MIRVTDLARTFVSKKGKTKTDIVAVSGVTFRVDEGEIVGFLGPNGAGKTTTLRMLTTLLKPTSGTASVAGFDVTNDAHSVRKNIGYVSQSGSTSREARAGEEVMDHGMLYGLARSVVEKRGKELFEQLDLEGMWDRQPKTMSGGQRRRLDIAMGLINDPSLVFLDEPTTGLDPQARANLWTHISALRKERNATVFLTTHYLDEADALCDRILVIDHGKIVASDTPDALKQQVRGDLIELVVKDHDQLPVAAKHLAAIVDGSTADVHDRTVSMRVPHAGVELPALLRSLDAAGVSLASIEVRRPTLDDVFLTVTGRSLRDEAS